MHSFMWISLYVLFSCVLCIHGVPFRLFFDKPVLKGNAMYLTCRVRKAKHLDAIIQFVRNSDNGNMTMISCQQRGSDCTCDNTGYTDCLCACSVNTNNTARDYKVYTLMKHATSDQDTGVWFCGSDDHGWSKPKVAVILTNPGLSVYPQHRVMTQPITLICSVIDQAVQHDVTFKRNSADICTCKTETKLCVVHKHSAKQYNCTHTYVWRRTATYELTMQSFTPCDSAPWSCCSTDGENNCSNVVKLQPNPTTDNNDWKTPVSHMDDGTHVSTQMTTIYTTQKTKREDGKSGSGSANVPRSNQLLSLTLPGVVGVLFYRLNL